MTSDCDIYRDVRGTLHVRCVACEDMWIPAWGAPVIAIGKLIRIENPRFLKPMANGVIDDREYITIPKIRRGYGCPACEHLFGEIVRATTRGRSPFIEVDDKRYYERPLATVVRREPKKSDKPKPRRRR